VEWAAAHIKVRSKTHIHPGYKRVRAAVLQSWTPPPVIAFSFERPSVQVLSVAAAAAAPALWSLLSTFAPKPPPPRLADNRGGVLGAASGVDEAHADTAALRTRPRAGAYTRPLFSST
jgi:hypothetical protein